MEKLSLSILAVIGLLSFSLTIQAECPNDQWGCWNAKNIQQDPLPEYEVIEIDLLHNELEQNLDGVTEIINSSIENTESLEPQKENTNQAMKLKNLSTLNNRDTLQ